MEEESGNEDEPDGDEDGFDDWLNGGGCRK
jgi:hypothetical protein